MVFADPPYFLSNDGLTVKNGKITSVNKGNWDKAKGFEYINGFNRKWLKLIRDKMKEDATIWISGTMHNIFSIGQILTELDFKILSLGKRQIHRPIFLVVILLTQPSKLFGQEKMPKFRIISIMT